MSKLASAVTAYTPTVPVTETTAKAIRAEVDAALLRLAGSVDSIIRSAPIEEAAAGEEEVIIITSPPPP